ncbi:MAG TPA: hypothetical protein RMH99_12715 [Sandaracinaceae bacterium LLY-WYZ-13_1]|nr:hypothetical protein [Sandaracinaceae bacterium LLY-WYZ-13_1]
MLCLAAALGGCGLTLDLQPPEDAGAGFDARVARDAGRPVECADDPDCDDGAFCNGAERCRQGRCVDGEAPDCDDGVACTVDACDESADACVRTADDDRCDDVGCSEGVCDAALGCTLVPDHGRCDDGVGCTRDRCADDACESLPVNSECASGQYCDPAIGCEPLPECAAAADCPDVVCKGEPSCRDGVCSYENLDYDPACDSADPCTPSVCVDGACDDLAPVECGSADPTSCERPICVRSSEGEVSCSTADRDGETCSGSDACTRGICDGATCVITTECTSADPCSVPVCDSATGTCSTTPYACGTHASCTPDGGAPSCVCDDGYLDCMPGSLGCECEVSVLDGSVGAPDGGTLCPLDRGDCDGDGTCECDLRTGWCEGMGPSRHCESYRSCSTACAATGEVCCPCDGTCVGDYATECTTFGEPCPMPAP